MPRRIVLADDAFIIREGVRLVLEQEGYEVVAVAEDLDGLLEAVGQHGPDVVVTDIRMPPTRTDEGIRAARQIRAERPEIGVVVLSQYVEPDYALRLLEDGSQGLAYLLKERVGDAGALADAVERVADGESKIDPKVVDALVAGRLAQKATKLDRLTPREREVLEELAGGKSNHAIAETLYLSERAVEKHINSIFTKLDLPTGDHTHRRVAAVLLYLGDSGHPPPVRPDPRAPGAP